MTIPPLTLPLYISFYTPLYSSLPPLWPALFWQSNSILFLYLLSTVYTPPFYIPSLDNQHCRILSCNSSITAGLPTGHKTPPHPVWLAPLCHSLSTFLFYTPYLLSYHKIHTSISIMVQLNCHLAPHWLQTTLALFWLQLILHCRLLSWYSSIAAGLPTGHKTTPLYD